jgi:cobalt-zinc-cadmium efflux system outer membrane protein
LDLEIEQSLNRLFKLANVERAETLDGEHTFFQNSNETLHPLLKVVEEQQKVSQAQLDLASHTIENISLFSEMEREPEQSIFRVGVSIPLPIFNKKSEEKQLAKIALANQKIFLNAQKKSLSLEMEQLLRERALLEKVKAKYEGLILEQRELLSMYQQGYAIAKVNLLKLSDTKQRLIQSKEKIVEARLQIERNSVKMNYLRGAGNE